jgi:hypothetical protein
MVVHSEVPNFKKWFHGVTTGRIMAESLTAAGEDQHDFSHGHFPS